MTSPLRIAKIAGARRVVAERLATAGCAFPDETARTVVDDLLNLGWVYPGWQLDDTVPQPSSSTPAHRARVLAGARHEIDQRRRQRGEGETA